MAIATTIQGIHRIQLSPLEQNISASVKGWQKYGRAVLAKFANHFGCDPKILHHTLAGFHVVEHRCLWADFVPAIMPLCDTIEIVSPPVNSRPEDILTLGRVFLSLERVLAGPSLIKILTATIEGVEFEFIRLSGLDTGDLSELVDLATTEPEIFLPLH